MNAKKNQNGKFSNELESFFDARIKNPNIKTKSKSAKNELTVSSKVEDLKSV